MAKPNTTFLRRRHERLTLEEMLRRNRAQQVNFMQLVSDAQAQGVAAGVKAALEQAQGAPSVKAALAQCH